MRISCHEDDPVAYANFLALGGFSAHIRVFLNGVHIEETVSFDSDTGEVWLLARDEWGDLIELRDSEGSPTGIQVELRRGLVSFTGHAVIRSMHCSRSPSAPSRIH